MVLPNQLSNQASYNHTYPQILFHLWHNEYAKVSQKNIHRLEHAVKSKIKYCENGLNMIAKNES